MQKGSNRVTPVGGNKTFFFFGSIRMWLMVYVLVNKFAVVPNLWTFKFTQYQGLYAAFGSHWEFWNAFEFHWDNPFGIPVKFSARIPLEFCGIPVRFLGSQWDSRHFLPVKSQWNSKLGLRWDHVGFAGIPPGIPVTFSRWNPSWFQWNPSWNFTGIPLGIPVKFSMGHEYSVQTT